MSSSRVTPGGGGGPSPARAQSSICLLWLLFCKTVKFQLANTLTSVIIILAPIIVFFIFSATAVFQNPEHDPERTYPSVNISTNVPNIYYSPKNRIVDDIIEYVVREVGAMHSKGYFTALELQKGLIDDSAFVGIEFADEFRRIEALPTQVSVAVRFPMNVRSLPKLRWDGRVFYKRLYLGSDYYLIEGFLIIQAKLSEALIRAKNEVAKLPEVDFKYLPEPNRMESTFKESRVALSGFLFLPFAISAAYLAQLIVEEKKIWGIMRMMQVRGWVHWMSWFLVAFFLFFIPTIVLVGLLKWRFYPMSDTSVVLVFFCVYIMEVVTSALVTAAIFSDTIGVQVTILFLHLFSWLPWRLMVMGYQANVRTIIACLFLNSALAMGLEEFIDHENLFMGMHWDRVFSRTDPNDTLTLGFIMVIMLMGTVLRFFILWYVEELKGVKARKWYFPCQFRFWCPQKCRRRRQRDRDIENQDTEEEQEYEHEPLTHRNRAIIVRARHLEKNYNGQKVIRDLCLNFYQDEICVFLGHNDSGKTTTFRMLAGIEEPSAGQITINGFDLATEKGKALRSMSMCPQKSMFFDKLKVRWHMKFFCRLNGMNRKEASAEADKYLAIAQMQEFASSKVNNLSSGFKRMLALCCSLCGHAKVVILDEPGTGMDPTLRRQMWDLLRKERKGRCIIMSTHNMLEAEVVADRVAVMCNGQVIGYGTSGFLTQIADSGASYFLICTKMDSCRVPAVTRFLQSRFPDVQLDNEYGIYIIYKLPAKEIQQYSKLFQELEEALDNLMIKEFSVRAPTLGDVFLRIGEEMRMTRDTTAISIEDQALSSPMSSLINLLPSFEVREDDTRVVCCNRWRAIMERKRLFLCRHRRFFLLIILLPVIMGVILIIFELVIFWLFNSQHALKITDLSYFSPAVVMLESSENNSITQKYTDNALVHDLEVRDTEGAPLGQYFVKLVEKDEKNHIRKVVAGATIDTGNNSIVAWANKKLEHGSALTLGLVYESLAWALAQLEIEIVNKPHVGAFGEAMGRLIQVSCMDFTIVVLLYLVVGTAIFAVMPVMERQTSLQHQQLCTGMSRITYWLSHLFWDYGVFLTMTPTMILIVGVAHNTAGPITILLLSFGFAVISFTYLVCLLSNNLGQMFSIMMYVNMIGVLSLFIHPKSKEDRYRVFEHVLMVHPHYALFNGVQDIIQMREILSVYHGGAGAKAINPSMDNNKPKMAYDFTSVQYLIISGIVYLMLVLMSWIPRRINYFFKACKTKKILPTLRDEDVEVDRIRQRLDFITTKNYSRFPVIMKDVTKTYGDVLAVRALTLDINPDSKPFD